MKLDKFTIKAQDALQNAQSLAEQSGNQELEPEHVLSALISQEDGVVPPLLRKLGINTSLLASRLQDRLNSFPKVSGAAASGAYISPRLKGVLDQAEKEADKFK